MNTGFLGPAVATVLTVYGIETGAVGYYFSRIYIELQQYLPFTVLKLICATRDAPLSSCNSTYRLRY